MITSSKSVRSIKDQMRQYKDFLVQRMDPDFGLLDQIRVNGTIGWTEMDDVKSQGSSCKRNSKLLDYILTKDQWDGLIAALRDANQMHIANYLTAKGEYSDEFGEDWPLTEKEIAILDFNHRSLVDLLELTDLLGLLYSSKVINRRQMDSLSSKPTQHEKNDALLDILRRRSLRDFRQTMICLRQSQQSHIAKILEFGGAVVRVHAHLDGENVTETENEISTTIANMIINERSTEEASRMLELVTHKVVAAKTGQSVVLYIYCKTIEELQQLHESLTSGRLKDSVEILFSRLLNRSQKFTVASLTTSNEEFENMRTYFIEEEISRRGLKRKHSSDTELTEQLQTQQRMDSTTETDHQPSKTMLNELPLEMLDVVLEKSFLHWILNSSPDQRDEDVVRAMAVIDFCWFQRLTRPRFKNRIWRRLKDFYGKTRKGSAIVRNNRNYLLDNIQSNYKLIASMLSFNCITEKQRHVIQRQRSNYSDNKKKEQSHFIQRQRSKQDKNSEILHQMRSFDERKFSNFVKCLRQTNQKTVARIIENGGEVTKVEVQNRSVKCTTSREEQLLFHKNIEDLRNRTKPWSHQTDKLISQLKEEGIEILNFHLDRQTVVVWIWCHSQAGLKHIRRVYESNQLRDVLFGLANIPEIDQSKVINIDSNQFKKAVVVRPISINFIQAIDVERDGVWGLTKLRNEIYVLCYVYSSGPNVIRVFEDRNPFNLQKIIIIKEITFPFDIESSEKENCLYVSDYDEKCLWKITREIDDEQKIIKWLILDYHPRTMSMSTDGRLLVVNRSSSSLMIYGSEAELIRSIQLPGDITYLARAVETSIGNFIISYAEKLEEEVEEVEEEDNEEEEEEEDKKEREEEEKEEHMNEEGKEGEKDEKQEKEKERDSWSRGRNSINVEKEEEEETTEGEVEEGEEEDMEDKREEKEDEEWGREKEGESGSNGRNWIIVEKDEDEEEDGKEEEGGKRDRVEEKERKSGSSGRKKKINSAICELTRDGQMIIRRFIPSNETQQLNSVPYLLLDSDDQVFVADYRNDRVILLDSDLKWNRILCPRKEETEEAKIREPYRLCYDEVKKQLIVGGHGGANVYTLSRK